MSCLLWHQRVNYRVPICLYWSLPCASWIQSTALLKSPVPNEYNPSSHSKTHLLKSALCQLNTPRVWHPFSLRPVVQLAYTWIPQMVSTLQQFRPEPSVHNSTSPRALHVRFIQHPSSELFTKFLSKEYLTQVSEVIRHKPTYKCLVRQDGSDSYMPGNKNKFKSVQKSYPLYQVL